MLKKISFIALLSVMFSVKILAHDFWVDGYNSSVFKAYIGYGHGFPNPEKIAEDRLDIFKPLSIIDKDSNKIAFKNKGANYQFVTQQPLNDGTYILEASTKNIYWTKTKDNKWEKDKTKKEVINARYCDKVTKFAKSIINIGNNNDDFINQKIGHKYEIIPLDNPINFKVGVPFKIQVLYNGKPAKTVKVKGTFGSYTKHQFAFLGTTDLRGKLEITPLRAGKWILMTEISKPLKDNKICDNEFNYATLTFQVK